MTQPIKIKTQDGYEIHGFEWRLTALEPLAPLAPLASLAPLTSPVDKKPRDVVIINPATSVKCRYYFRFAQYLFDQGFDVITYDYRGIGESKPKSLRGFKASWVIWGEKKGFTTFCRSVFK